MRLCSIVGKHSRFLNQIDKHSILIQAIHQLRWYSEKKIFSRDKPCCKVGTIGHAKHGKTTVTAAITKLLGNNGIDSIEKSESNTIKSSQVEYATENRQYIHTDCPGDASYVKNMMSGVTQMDGV